MNEPRAIPPYFTLTYLGNDAGGPPAQGIPYPIHDQPGASVILDSTTPARAGYLFTGWNTDASGGGITYQPGAAFGPITANTLLYAQWLPSTADYHYVIFYGNDAGGPPVQEMPDPILAPAGQNVLLTEEWPQRRCYRFIGWNTSPDGTGTMYQPGDLLPPITSDLPLYAQWTMLPPADRTILYHGNTVGGPAASCIPAQAWVPYGQNTVLSGQIPQRDCYCFVGWNTAPSGLGAWYHPGQCINNVTANINLYAQWRPEGRRPKPGCCSRGCR